jgi:3-deoxy-manno-octulosonate cytidylyltransferase (CMP-KDO synthetase)
MIEHVYRRAAAAGGTSRVVVLTDDERIMRAVARFGGEAELTPRDCPSGTDRIAVAARGWTAAAVINVQGDEPLIDPAVIEAVAARIVDPEEEIVTVATPAQLDELDDPHVVKVVVGQDGRALYFSRACIPHHRDPDQTANPTRWKHLGIYGYRHDVLLRLASLAPTPLEQAESLEQLRALEHGIKIRVLTGDRAESGVDTIRDLARVKARLASDSHGPGPNQAGPNQAGKDQANREFS